MEVPWIDRYVVAGSTRFFIRELGRPAYRGLRRGNGVVLLLHGWPENGQAWRAVGRQIADAGWRVVCPDLKGFGRSKPLQHGYDQATLTSDMCHLLNRLGIGKAVVVGHDWGGMVAIATAQRYPDRIQALVASCVSYPDIDLRRAWHVGLLGLPLLPPVSFRHFPRPLVTAALRYWSFSPDIFTKRLVSEYVDAVSAQPEEWTLYYRMALRAVLARLGTRHIRKRYTTAAESPPDRRPRMPATVIWGARDPLLSVAMGYRTAEAIDARFVCIPNSGHFPHEEAPGEFAKAVLETIGSRP